MEEIDIIELLKRVKEGKAPKEIEINGNEYNYCPTENNIQVLYQRREYCWDIEDITFDTKIKILDKPIIGKIDITNKLITNHAEVIITKLNEVIDYINNKE